MRGRRAITDWLDERIGIREIHRVLFARKIPAGAGWLYTLGSVTLFLLIVQVTTGIFMAMSYAPTPDHAYDSVRYLTEEAPFGWLLRGLHVWGASAMLVVVLLHLLRTFFTGAYKFPRELTWLSGVVLLLFVIGFGFTGYLLPWNQRSYWATEVGTRIAAQAPLLGPTIARVLRGGEEIGAQTLTRFYAVHVLLLPALIVALLGLHLFLVLRQGISAPPSRGETTPLGSDSHEERSQALARYHHQKEAGESFFPYTLAKDIAVVLIVLGVLFALAVFLPPEVGELADPTDTTFNPRPEWYFLFLFQLLKYFPGRLEAVVAIVLPSLGIATLLALPFFDRSRRRHPLDRPLATGLAVGCVVLVSALTVAGVRSPVLSAYVPPAPVVAAGARSFQALDCNHCHSVRGEGGAMGPDLALGPEARDIGWMMAHFKNPSAVVTGPSMPTVGAIDAELAGLLAYVAELRGGGPPSPKAPKLYRRYCSECHMLDGRGGDKGPDLSDIGSVRTRGFIHRYTEDPKSLVTDSRMPAFLQPVGPLSHMQIEDISRFLAQHRPAAPAPDSHHGEKTP